LHRVDGGRSIENIGGKAALGIEIARNVADGADDREPALRLRDPIHGLVFRHGDVGGKAASDGRERDDGGGQKRTDFHGNVRHLRSSDIRLAGLILSLRMLRRLRAEDMSGMRRLWATEEARPTTKPFAAKSTKPPAGGSQTW